MIKMQISEKTYSYLRIIQTIAILIILIPALLLIIKLNDKAVKPVLTDPCGYAVEHCDKCNPTIFNNPDYILEGEQYEEEKG